MKIDWKAVACSEGYKALKEQFMNDSHKSATSVHRPMRSKDEHRRLFRKIIDRAKSNAVRTNRTLIEVLDDWAVKGRARSNWWYNSYTQLIGKQSRDSNKKCKGISVKTYHKRTAGRRLRGTKHEKMRARDALSRAAKVARLNSGKKARYTMEVKRRNAEVKEYEAQQRNL